MMGEHCIDDGCSFVFLLRCCDEGDPWSEVRLLLRVEDNASSGG